jgi:hypothetical protein
MRSRCCLGVCLCVPPIVARQWLGENTLIVARQLLGKNLHIVARQRLGKNPLGLEYPDVPLSLQANAAKVLRLGHERRFLPAPFQFIIRQSTYHSMPRN